MASARSSKRKRDTHETDPNLVKVPRHEQSDDRGRRLLPHVVDALAAQCPGAAWILIPRSNDPRDGFQSISYGLLANAVNRAAQWLQNIDGQLNSGAVAYLGPSDARYPVLILGVLKAGHHLLPLSPHNSTQTQVDVLSQAGCKVLLCARQLRTAALEIVECSKETNPIEVPRVVPSVAELLDPSPVAPSPYNKTYDEERNNTFLQLHTSGTTGGPKVITLPHGYYSYEDLSRSHLDNDAGEVITSAPFEQGTRILFISPLWHAGGMFYGLLKPILNRVTAIFTPSSLPVSAGLAHDCLIHSEAHILHAPPSLLLEMLQDAAYHGTLQHLKCIITGSGPFPHQAGNKLLQLNRNTVHFFGLTETDLLPLLRLNDPLNDWQYHHFHPLSGATFHHVMNGLHELVIERLKDVTQPCFEIHLTENSFHTGDLFMQHPNDKRLWKHEGRIDDIITLSSGEKVNPTGFEAKISELPMVSGALVVGRGRLQVALLVEILEGDVTEDILDDLWSLVSAANDDMPTYGRVSRMLLAVAARPFERTVKGTLRRRQTEKLLQPQISSMYSAAAAAIGSVMRTPSGGVQLDDTHQLVHDVHSNVLGKVLHPESDIFEAGMDSLKVAQVVRSLNESASAQGGGRTARKLVTPAMLYEHRSIRRISEALHSKMLQGAAAGGGRGQNHPATHERLLSQHLARLAPASGSHTKADSTSCRLKNVILTGSTGSLGKYILHSLLYHDGVDHVHCFDRSHYARTVYLEAFPEDERLLSERTTFHVIRSLQSKKFSLDDESYHQLQKAVTHIVHNAWPVHFHLPLESATSTDSETEISLNAHVGGVANLIDFAATAQAKPKIVFVSSISSVLRYKDPITGGIPERIIPDPTAPQQSDYARSKWIAEQVLDRAARSGKIVSPFIIRPGQIAGPIPEATQGDTGNGRMWNVKEVVPSMIISSKTLGALPDNLGEKDKIRWVPVDICAQTVVDLAEHAPGPEAGAQVYNVTNMNIAEGDSEPLTWSGDLLSWVKDRLEGSSSSTSSPRVTTVALPEWNKRMEAHGATPENPAFRLSTFYEELASSDRHEGLGGNIETSKAHAVSAALRDLGSVQKSWMMHWMQGWGL